MDVSVSIIIPVYNAERYLSECLDSVLKQTVSFEEIIIVNDGSTDGSKEICRRYETENTGIRLIEQENAGLSAARNTGLEIAKGDYIVFLDSDDMVSHRMCETIKRVAGKKGDLDVVYYGSEIIKEVPIAFPEEGYSRSSKIAGTVLDGFESLKKLFPEYYQMSACMSAYRNEFLKGNNIWFIKGILYEDRFFSLRVVTEAESVIYVTDKLYIRRFRADSIIMSPASRRKIEDVTYGHKAEWNYMKSSKKWTDDMALTQYYALCSFYMAFQEDVSSCLESKEQMEYVSAFVDFWFSDLDISIMSANELALLLFVLQKAEKGWSMENFIHSFGTRKKFDQYKEEVESLLTGKCKEKLRGLPLDRKVRGAIYGIGRHTECMLDLYQTMIGNISSDIYFIVSEDSGESKYQGREIRQVENLYQDTEYVIISSKMYQADMCKRLEAACFDCGRAVTLYNENDAVDFVIIAGLLQTA